MSHTHTRVNMLYVLFYAWVTLTLLDCSCLGSVPTSLIDINLLLSMGPLLILLPSPPECLKAPYLVPCSSFLPSMVFLIFLSCDSLVTGYTNDVTYSQVVMEDDVFTKVNSDLGVISDWLLSQNLRLNIGKVKCMWVFHKRSGPLSSFYRQSEDQACQFF